jgi:hypothetical protein
MRTLTSLALAGVLAAAAPAWAAPADHAEWFLDAQAVRPTAAEPASPTGAWRLGGQGLWHGAFLLSELGWVGPHAGPEAGIPHGPSWEGEAMAGPAVPIGALMISPGLAFRGLRVEEEAQGAHLEHALGLGLHAEVHWPFATFGEGNLRYYPAITGIEVHGGGPASSGFQAEFVASREFDAPLVPGLGYRYERWGDTSLQIIFGRLSWRPGVHAHADETPADTHAKPQATAQAAGPEWPVY